MATTYYRLAVAVAVLALAGCNDTTSDDTPAANADAETVQKTTPAAGNSPGKPSPPITIDYNVLGTAIVGQPVAIEITVRSPLTDTPMSMNYFINDADSMLFPESQSKRIDLRIPADRGAAAQQVTVVPQREGRLYLNVTAEIETERGMMMKAMAIPLSVGRATNEPEVNGELQQGPDGESVISMPAKEN